jgi:uncharacterized phage-like protein YoqJ
MYDKTKTACFTGHRIAAFHTLGISANIVKLQMCHLLEQAIIKAYNEGYRNFISGGAIGVDQWAMEVLIHLKSLSEYSDIKLIVARPFPSQACKWPLFGQEEYLNLCKAADEIVDVSEDPYQVWKMHQRNAWMVDHSSLLIAVKFEQVISGGTASCFSYGRKQGLNIIHIDPETNTLTYIEGNV